MAEAPPKIQVSDSQGKDARSVTASPAPSPIKDAFGIGKSSRPQSKGSSAENSRRSHSGNRIDSLKLIKSGTSDLSKRNSVESPTTPRTDPQSSVDPLSQYILNRASTSAYAASHDPTLDRVATDVFNPDDFGMAVKEKKKGVSFLGRLMPGKKKDLLETISDDPTEQRDDRPEGAHVEPFYQTFDNMGFSPKYPQPPRYIKIRSQGKKEKEFNRVFLAQVLEDKRGADSYTNASVITESKIKKSKRDNGDATWALVFSKDGQYLATGGQDRLVRIWATLSSREARRMHEKEEEAEEGGEKASMRLSAPVFRKKPIRTYEGHTSPVLDLSWSKNNFLLSSSMDKTVRLWHVSRAECLCTFKHSDFVTSIQFHPRDDRFFLAGSLDAKVRLWSIPDKKVAFWNQMPEMITAVAFTPDGKTAIAGSLTGLCHFFDTEGLKYQTQLHNKSAYGKNAKGSKITGIQAMTVPPDDPNGDIKLLITSNDSRIRLYNLRDKTLEMKFKGNENSSSQIHARFSDDGRYIVCGSEDKRVYIWSLSRNTVGGAAESKKDKRPVEVFEAHAAITTVAALAPTKTRQLLSNSEDPIYDICNPPPVMLVSRSEVESIHSSKGATESGSIQPTPATAEGGGSFPRKPEESPAYIARSAHPNGNVIVTADVSGSLKVFRQDCAHEKRRISDFWAGGDSASILSKTFGGGANGSSSVHRRASMMTHDSARSGGRRSRHDSNATQAPRERILSWRQAIAAPEKGATRSASPHKLSQRSLPGSSSQSVATSPALVSLSTPSLQLATSTDAAGNGHRSHVLAAAGDMPIPKILRQSSDVSSPKALSPVLISPSSSGAGTSDQSASNNTPNPSSTVKASADENTRGRLHARPAELDRSDSANYYRYTAWQDQMLEQLRPERAHVDCEHALLGVPLARRSTAVSRLSSETGSDEPGSGAAGAADARSRSVSHSEGSASGDEGFEDAQETR